MLPIAPPLVVAVVAQVLCQLFKVVAYSLRERRLALSYFTTAGGMPSAHSAFVTALTTAVALTRGITSDLFAVAAVFSAIVIYDAYRLRGHVQQQAAVINRLAERLGALDGAGARPEPPRPSGPRPTAGERLSEMVGHTPAEIVAGIVFGVVFALLASALLGAVGLA
ncbi:MAG: divergent PAP2 family protein [Spirochaetota bacterium]